jgi:DNA-directed RNA polymerase specialized sigma24 family protein
MTNKEKVERLKQYRLLQLQHVVITRKDNIIYEQYLQLKEKLNNPAPTNQQLSDMPSNHTTSNPTENNYIMLLELESRLHQHANKEAQRLLNIVNEREAIENAINQLQDKYYNAILTMRYINGVSWERIAVTVNYSYKHTKRLHWRAVEKVKL